MRVPIIFITLSVGWLSNLHAQSLSPNVIASAGNVDRTDHVQLEWTLGELATEGTTGHQPSYTEGFHQPFVYVTPVTPHNNPKTQESWSANVMVVPNPVATTLTVQFKNTPDGVFQMALTNPEGKVIQHESLLSGESQKEFNLATLACGVYYLQIQSADGQTQQVYKISKIQ